MPPVAATSTGSLMRDDSATILTGADTMVATTATMLG